MRRLRPVDNSLSGDSDRFLAVGAVTQSDRLAIELSSAPGHARCDPDQVAATADCHRSRGPYGDNCCDYACLGHGANRDGRPARGWTLAPRISQATGLCRGTRVSRGIRPDWAAEGLHVATGSEEITASLTGRAGGHARSWLVPCVQRGPRRQRPADRSDRGAGEGLRATRFPNGRGRRDPGECGGPPRPPVERRDVPDQGWVPSLPLATERCRHVLRPESKVRTCVAGVPAPVGAGNKIAECWPAMRTPRVSSAVMVGG